MLEIDTLFENIMEPSDQNLNLRYLRSAIIVIIRCILVAQGLRKCLTESSDCINFSLTDRYSDLIHYAQRPIQGTLANRVDPDQTPQNATSDQDLHCYWANTVKMLTQ